MHKKENLKFLGCEISKASYESRNGVKGGTAKFTDKNGGIHFRNGFGHETVYEPAKHLVFGKGKNGQIKVCDLFKTIYFILGKLNKVEKEKIAQNITSALKDSGQIPAVSFEGSNFFSIDEEDFKNLNEIGAILSKYSDFQEPIDFFLGIVCVGGISPTSKTKNHLAHQTESKFEQIRKVCTKICIVERQIKSLSGKSKKAE